MTGKRDDTHGGDHTVLGERRCTARNQASEPYFAWHRTNRFHGEGPLGVVCIRVGALWI